MPETNGVMMHYFHWHLPSDGRLWRELSHNAEQLAALGITSFCIPPAHEGSSGAEDVAYGTYDLFDLGEFDQKGSIRTKYGTRDELIAACNAAKAAGLRIDADAVFNHKLGADTQEDVDATPYDPENRTVAVGEPATIPAWTHFAFPGRAGRHSRMEWHWHHFTAVDHDDGSGTKIFLFKDEQFDSNVDDEKGNYDFLIGCEIDMQHPEVRSEIEYWGEWFVHPTGVDGFRFDVDAGRES